MSEREETLSDAERLRRIGDILCRAIIASGLTAGPGDDDVADAEAEIIPPVFLSKDRLAGTEDRVIKYLARVGEASPAILRTVIQLPRTSAYRVLNGLVESGRIVSDGQTRALVYRLGDWPAHQHKVGDN